MKKYLFFSLAFVSFGAGAQSAPVMVPAIERVSAAQPMQDMELPQAQIQLTDKDRAALAIAREWRNNPDKPRRSADGTVMYLFGATLPTLICTPLQVCSIRLQPGEVVNHVKSGDEPRWQPEPAVQGIGANRITMVIVKPTDYGLTTNLIVTTDRRTYTILLKSARHEWYNMAFDYPDDSERAWENYRLQQGKVAHATTMATGENLDGLDFNYRLSGDNPKWKPIRVYNNGSKTTIEFEPRSIAGDAPAFVTIGKGTKLWSGSTEQIVNYRPKGNNRYEVDEVFDQGALISGVGNAQTRVTIDYLGGKKQ